MDRAFFVRYPRRIEDLYKPHLPEREHTYEVVKEIILAVIDYENFITDMCADRQFIEDHSKLCSEGDPMKCLLVRQRGKSGGVLVVPDASDYCAYVKWAAYVTEA